MQAGDGAAKTVEEAGEGQGAPTKATLRHAAITKAAHRHESLTRIPVRCAGGNDVVGQHILISQHALAAHALHTIDVGQLIGRIDAFASEGADECAARDAEVVRREAGQRGRHLTPLATAQGEFIYIDCAGDI